MSPCRCECRPDGIFQTGRIQIAAAGGPLHRKPLLRHPMPLIPGINDDIQNIKETGEFLRGLGNNALHIELMPYHRLGKGKYESLDKEYHLSGVPSPEPDEVESVKKAFEVYDIICLISR